MLRRLSRELTGSRGNASKFNVKVFNEIIRRNISPFVDHGWYCTREVEKTIHELLKTLTSFRHLTENKVFQEIAIIPMIFGQLSGGLRQLSVRKILNHALFEKHAGIKPLWLWHLFLLPIL